jgi:hypothetical protein
MINIFKKMSRKNTKTSTKFQQKIAFFASALKIISIFEARKKQ